MYFSLIRLRRDIQPRDLAVMTKGDGYQIHKLVWNLFSDQPDQPRDFLYRHESVGEWPTFYTVSEREPQDPGGMWDVVPKEYRPKLERGQRLGFTLCVNPIRSKRDADGRQHRHDVIMDAKRIQKDRGESIVLPDIVQEHGSRWLMERAEANGFLVQQEHLRVDGYRQHKFFKGKGRRPISFSTVEMNGMLTVTDPKPFTNCLFTGIGPAKGFGCGLLLVRRV
jgi:CRISPR system Cascade subunit CasE